MIKAMIMYDRGIRSIVVGVVFSISFYKTNDMEDR